jgi:NADH-quinone oxidoreductase subunit J
MDKLELFLFLIIALTTGICAIMVVATQNIVRAATWLLFTLAGTSGIFFLLGADLVGATQLLVYVGGTLVLVVFGVMLTAQEPFISMKTGAAEWAISAVVGFLLLSVLAISAYSITRLGPPENSVAKRFAPKNRLAEDKQKAKKDAVAEAQYSAVIGEGFLGVGVGPAHKEPRPEGKPVRTHYLLPFEIVSVHLLVVLIGAAYLARAKRRRRVA